MTDKLINGVNTVLNKRAAWYDKALSKGKEVGKAISQTAGKAVKKGKKAVSNITGATEAKANKAVTKATEKARKAEGGSISDVMGQANKVKKTQDIATKATKNKKVARGVAAGVGGIGVGAGAASVLKGDKKEKPALNKKAYGMGVDDELEDIPYQTDEKYKLKRILDTIKRKSEEEQVGWGPVGMAAGLSGLAGGGLGAVIGGPKARKAGAGIGAALGAGLGGLSGMASRSAQGVDIRNAKDLSETISDKDNLQRYLGLYLKQRSEEGKAPGEPWERASGALEDQETKKEAPTKKAEKTAEDHPRAVLSWPGVGKKAIPEPKAEKPQGGAAANVEEDRKKDIVNSAVDKYKMKLKPQGGAPAAEKVAHLDKVAYYTGYMAKFSMDEASTAAPAAPVAPTAPAAPAAPALGSPAAIAAMPPKQPTAPAIKPNPLEGLGLEQYAPKV